MQHFYAAALFGLAPLALAYILVLAVLALHT